MRSKLTKWPKSYCVRELRESVRLCDLAYCASSVSVDGDMEACSFGPFIYAMGSGVYRDVFF